MVPTKKNCFFLRVVPTNYYFTTDCTKKYEFFEKYPNVTKKYLPVEYMHPFANNTMTNFFVED